MEIWAVWVTLIFTLFFSHVKFCHAQMPDFVSLDCGATEGHTDELGLQWVPDNQFKFGQTANISVPDETRKQYMTLRSFPLDNRKYCYTLNVTSRRRYLVRATFLYGNFDNQNVYPKFDVSLGATPWSTIVISDANTIEKIEMIFLAGDSTVSVCLSNATTGQPFISTLELRIFNGSMYITEFEEQYYLSVSARINFGADSIDPVRYPDDPYDRIWESDSVKRANYLVDVAAGTDKISTKTPIDINRNDRPPQKVMQTAVVGRNGTLSYRLNLDGFPAPGWAFTYFAEIEDIAPNDLRKFRLMVPDAPQVTKAAVNIIENAQGKYRLYEPGFMNLTLPFVLSFKFMKTPDSTLGPLLNAMEINKYVQRNSGSLDGRTIASLVTNYPFADWAHEGGDPCLPVPLSWLECNSDPHPLITKVRLSRTNLTGNIPSELTNLNGLVELWLDGNSLTGDIPDFSGCSNLKIIHLENNQLTGSIPSTLAPLENLKELYTGNVNIHKGRSTESQIGIIIGAVIGAAVLIVAAIVCCLCFCKEKNPKKKYGDQARLGHVLPSHKLQSSSFENTPNEAAHCFTFSELEEATKEFEKKIGSGGYGVVYYGPLTRGRGTNWIQRLEIAEDAAKGIEYLHTGCVPSIIHRDLKTSNILLDKNMRAKVSDFGLSKLAVDGTSHVSSIVRGTVGYLDPEYYISQQLTDKSDVYSFGVILLELISGQEAISNENFGVNCRNIVQWAKLHIESGDIQGIIDPSLRDEYDIQSMWKIAEKALMCVQAHGHMRPSMSEVLKEVQDAIMIEKEGQSIRQGNSDDISKHSFHSSIHMGSLDLGPTDSYLSIDESIARPMAR
ncbi:hypothetical protein KSS87_005105 [Heliosperma pusillum]|nr:hypothetical protein KSS87_005105 [Heliosperma pusillum]